MLVFEYVNGSTSSIEKINIWEHYEGLHLTLIVVLTRKSGSMKDGTTVGEFLLNIVLHLSLLPL